MGQVLRRRGCFDHTGLLTAIKSHRIQRNPLGVVIADHQPGNIGHRGIAGKAERAFGQRRQVNLVNDRPVAGQKDDPGDARFAAAQIQPQHRLIGVKPDRNRPFAGRGSHRKPARPGAAEQRRPDDPQDRHALPRRPRQQGQRRQGRTGDDIKIAVSDQVLTDKTLAKAGSGQDQQPLDEPAWAKIAGLVVKGDGPAKAKSRGVDAANRPVAGRRKGWEQGQDKGKEAAHGAG